MVCKRCKYKYLCDILGCVFDHEILKVQPSGFYRKLSNLKSRNSRTKFVLNTLESAEPPKVTSENKRFYYNVLSYGVDLDKITDADKVVLPEIINLINKKSNTIVKKESKPKENIIVFDAKFRTIKDMINDLNAEPEPDFHEK